MSKQLRINGFTLIELLAVIAIIAIIALITTPIISNVLNDANENAFLDTAHSINRAANNYYAEKVMEANSLPLTITYNDGEISSKRGALAAESENYLGYTGKHPDSGQVYIDENGDVSMAIYDNKSGKCVEKNDTYKQPAKTDKSKGSCTLGK